MTRLVNDQVFLYPNGTKLGAVKDFLKSNDYLGLKTNLQISTLVNLLNCLISPNKIVDPKDIIDAQNDIHAIWNEFVRLKKKSSDSLPEVPVRDRFAETIRYKTKEIEPEKNEPLKVHALKHQTNLAQPNTNHNMIEIEKKRKKRSYAER